MLSEDMYKEKLDSIDRANAFLQQCTNQSILLEPSRRKRRFGNTETDFKSIRKYATSLYKVIFKGNSWKCKCRDHHVASLRLEVRPCTSRDSNTRGRFHMLLCKKVERDVNNVSDWRSIAVEPDPDPFSSSLGPSDGSGAHGSPSVHKSR